MTTKAVIKFPVLNRNSGVVQFHAEIKCNPDEVQRVKLGLAVKWAIKADANLAGAYLARANLAGASLTGAYLADASLTGANLADANLAGANLAGADLTGAYLADARLTGAYLAGANLAGASLTGAYLADASLAGADLAGADLTGAYLAGASLRGAYLAGANLTDAKGAELAIARTRILPEGDLIGWKKCRGGVIVKLRIPADAKRSHAFGRKCRAEFVDVLEVIGAEVGVTNQHGPETHYRAGERVKPDGFDENWQNECASGIHFWITRSEAEAY